MSFSSPDLQRRWKALPGEPVGDAGDVYTGYDRFGRTERMRWGKLGDGDSFSPLVDVSWGYSPASQKTWRKDLLAPPDTAQDQKFNYDGLYQVTQRQRGLLNIDLTAAGGIPAQQEDFSYDETGNWKSYRQQNDGTLSIDQARVNNPSNQITQVDGSAAGVSYDGNGNMLRVPMGDALSDPSNRVVRDGWNRPVQVYDAEDTLIAEYRYDGLGRRITVESGGVTRHSYYDDQWRSVEERIDDSTTAERQHVWHPADRWEMILRDRSTANNGTMDERLYPMKDQLDPVALSDDSGTVVERYDYTAFGIPAFLDSSFIPQPSSFAWSFLFHAEFQDTDTGWFNYGYRYYVPMLGRWLSRDPIGEGGGVNLNRFITNDPVNRIDYLGMALPPANNNGGDPTNLTLSFKTESGPTPGECGSASWRISWSLSAKSTKGGKIVQRIRMTEEEAKDCSGKDIKLNLDRNYTEMFEVLPGSDTSVYKDTFSFAGRGNCTRGRFVIEGEAQFHEGMNALPAGYAQANARSAGQLNSKPNVQDVFKNGSNAVQRRLILRWSCCADSAQGTKRQTVIVEP